MNKQEILDIFNKYTQVERDDLGIILNIDAVFKRDFNNVANDILNLEIYKYKINAVSGHTNIGVKTPKIKLDIKHNDTSDLKFNKSNIFDHPKYYNKYSIEAVDMATKIWGKDAMRQCAEITAFFYRMRAGYKDNIVNDLNKEKWWLDKAKTL